MTKNIAIISLIAVFSVLIICIIMQPSWLSDSNQFVGEFAGRDMLPILGVILAITLASAAQLHLEFNKIEEKAGREILNKSRTAVRGAAYGLIGLFLVGSFLSVVKSIVCHTERAQATVNGLCLFVLFFNIIILVEIIQAAFAIPAKFDN
jgi:hypothetical protein